MATMKKKNENKNFIRQNDSLISAKQIAYISAKPNQAKHFTSKFKFDRKNKTVKPNNKIN